jgi:DNA (cytosine-5)-methyltransferase 1
MPIPIIDLFAGPGGLGEGFTSVLDKKGNRAFKIALSIERDEFAHQTLTLRSFLRQFAYNKYPKEYYQFLQGEIETVEELFDHYPEEAENAKREAWKFELGNPETHDIIDKRIKESLKGEKKFILIGGPPCQAYSLVGRARRQEGKGLNKEDERVFLYREYYRILAVHKPPVFVMENVKGLLSSRVNNDLIFNQLLHDLQNPVESYRKLQGKKKLKNGTKYRIYSLVKGPRCYTEDGNPAYDSKDFVIRAEEYGIPQTRHRVILLGVRSDVDIKHETLRPLKILIPVKDVLKGLPPLRSGLSKGGDSKTHWKEILTNFLNHPVGQDIDRKVWKEIERSITRLKVPQKDRGDLFVPCKVNAFYNKKWFLDTNLGGVINHETRSHIEDDLLRYLFVAAFGKVHKRSPKLSDFPKSILPKHENTRAGITENKFADRFRVQLENEPSKTITSHISKDGHYYIHPDPAQCRSLTVREAARIQTFPDNYFFCGPRTEQYHQVGNAVPPLIAFRIAQLIIEILTGTNLFFK